MSALNVQSRWLWLILVAGIVTAPLFASDDDRPGRGVARLSLMQGDVSVRRGDSGEWLAAAPNAPLVVEDRVLTGVNSKAEVQLDYANFLRLAQNSEVRFSELEYGRFQVQVAHGTVTARALRDSESEVEINTPNVSVRPSKRGVYRITVRADGSTDVTVRSGEVEIYTPRGTERLKSGRTMMVRGTSTDPEFQIDRQIPEDDWDEWNERRDRDRERSQSYRYVSPSISGAEDLDAHGQWVYDPPYGHVWVPAVSAGWAPYRHGRWSWVDFYGWSWVSYDPWGWAPYHYGRWYMGSRGWCWWPGGIRSRHFWSPGLVAWVGFGGGVNVGVGFGGGWGRMGWIPLAPHEPYHRWYGWNYYRGNRNRGGYVDNSVNVVNNINITNVYRNARVSNGVTAVDAGDFRNGRYTAARLTDSDFRQASLVRGQVPLTPERAHLRLADRDATVQGRGNDNGRFFSRRSPSPVERVSFDDQRRGADDVRRRTFGDQTAGGETVRGGDPVRGGDRRGDVRSGDVRADRNGERAIDRTADRTADRSSGGGWRRFGGPRDAAISPESRSPESGGGLRNQDSNGAVRPAESGRDRGSWRRFGDPSGDSGGNVDSTRGSGRNRGWLPDDSGPARQSPRFESPRGDSPRTEVPAGNDAPAVDRGGRSRNFRSDEGGWRRFGEGSNGGATESNGVSTPIVRERGGSRSSGSERPARMEGWRQENRTLDPGRSRGSSPGFESPRQQQSAPRLESRPPRMEGFGGGGGRSGGNPGGGMRMEGGGGGARSGGGNGGGGGGRSSGGDGGGRGGRNR